MGEKPSGGGGGGGGDGDRDFYTFVSGWLPNTPHLPLLVVNRLLSVMIQWGVKELTAKILQGNKHFLMFLCKKIHQSTCRVFLHLVPTFNPVLKTNVILFLSPSLPREVTELVTGNLPFVHLSTECRCPPSHPVINPNNEAFCLQHTGGGLTNRGVTDRINSLAHPAGFINDLASSDGWISTPGVPEVNVTLTLTNSLYEVRTIQEQQCMMSLCSWCCCICTTPTPIIKTQYNCFNDPTHLLFHFPEHALPTISVITERLNDVCGPSLSP